MGDTDDHARHDKRWFWWAGAGVTGFLIFSMTVGLVLLPIAQAPNAGLTPWEAICRALGIAPGTPAQPQPPVSAQAEPVSQVTWSPRTLRILASADPRPGAVLAEEVCVSCHGEEGLIMSDTYPKLAGQTAEAIYKQLSDYRSGARVHPDMTPVVEQMTTDQLAQVAAYYGNQFSGAALGKANVQAFDDIERLIYAGDPARRLPPCESCHARGAGGPPEAPAIAGQSAPYLENQLMAYKTGERRNDVYRRMRDIAELLTDDEIRRLSRAYQGTY